MFSPPSLVNAFNSYKLGTPRKHGSIKTNYRQVSADLIKIYQMSQTLFPKRQGQKARSRIQDAYNMPRR